MEDSKIEAKAQSSDAYMTNSDEMSSEEDEQQQQLEERGPLFGKDDRIFAKDNTPGPNNNRYYPATIRSRRKQNGSWQYKVHYQGWNSRWDQWLSDDRILKDTEQNRRFLEVSKLLESGGGGAAASLEEPAAKSKRKRDDDRSCRKRRATGAANNLRSLYEEFCELPLTLKTVLVDEMAHITRLGYDSPHSYDNPPSKTPARVVYQLPAPVTIQQVLKHFCKKRSQQAAESHNNSNANNNNKAGDENDKSKNNALEVGGPTVQDVEDFCEGLSKLFQEALPKFLLYPQERPQYNAMVAEKDLSQTRLTEIYGCEFLLRLYVRLPALMQSENVSNIRVVGPLLADLLVLLQKNRQACFKGSYREPRPDEWTDSEKVVGGAL